MKQADDAVQDAEAGVLDEAQEEVYLFPLSFAQERLWILEQIEPGEPAYHMPYAYRIVGPLDVAALARSLKALVARHESLRTRFAVIDGAPVQAVGAVGAFYLDRVDLRSLPQLDRDQELQRVLADVSWRPFSLLNGPLFRACLIMVAGQEHVLVLVMHHSISDGWSWGIFFEELATLYAACIAGASNPLPELPVQYADYAVWQREWLAGPDAGAQLAYWRDRLTPLPEPLQLPADRSRPAMRSHAGAVLSMQMTAQQISQLQALGRDEQATLFMVLLAAFKVLLHRLSGQSDIVVGVPVAGRAQVEIETVIGCFLNSLVLRTGVASGATFRQVLRAVRSTALDAYAHRDIPFEKLLEILHPERDMGSTPLFQVFFNLFASVHGVAILTLPGLQVEPLPPARVHSKFDFTLYLQPDGDGLNLELVYATELFDEARMRGFLEQYVWLLEQAMSDPERDIARYSLVTPGMRAQLPDPRTPLDAAWQGSVMALFARHTARQPAHLAVIDSHGAWTYADLETRSNRLANYLRLTGVQPEDVVAIYAHRSAALVWALLGVLKAGAAFLILDPAYPSERLAAYLRQARPRGWLQLEAAGELPVVLARYLAQQPLCCRLTLPGLAHTGSASGESLLARVSPEAPEIDIGPDHLAYVAFTSGSTGTPKGVLGRHGPLSYFISWQQPAFGITGADRFSMVSGLAHDPLQRDIFTALCTGATLCIPDPETLLAPGALAAWMAEQQITFAHLTPPMTQVLAETSGMPIELPVLRVAFFVGDKLTRRDTARLRALAPQATCYNSYGATETQRAVGYYRVPDESGEEELPVYPLGKGMPSVQLLVLTAERQLAGAGELGEIYVRSPHLAAGYLDDPVRTQERFVANPFTGDPADRLYRTGDLGRYLPDGNVSFAGRADRQVKVRGFRIEPAEIEAVLTGHDAVREAVVVLDETIMSGGGLVAYVVVDDPTLPDSPVLRRWVADRLPHHMVPAAFVPLAALPLTPNGKLDRRALPRPGAGNVIVQETSLALQDDVEMRLAAIWAAVLERDAVGIHDDFFALGGHSLLAIRLFSRVEAEFGERLPAATLFRSPTIAAQAALLRKDAPLSRSPLAPVQPEGDRPPFFCVHGFGGGVVGYAGLARALGAGQPFYGLQARGGEGEADPHASIEEMAAYYVAALRAVQPRGPYNLGGYCYGGVVAYEMAQQLHAAGERVALLALMEAYVGQPVTLGDLLRRPEALLHFLGNVPFWTRDFLFRGDGQQWPRVRARVSMRAREWRALRRWLPDVPGPASHPDFEVITGDVSEIPAYRRAVMQAHGQARLAYRPAPYPGRVTVFRVRGMRLRQSHDPTYGWGALALGGVDIRRIAGAHYNILAPPYVVDLAQHLGDALQAANEIL